MAVGLLGPGSQIRRYTRYINAPIMVFIPERTVVAKGQHCPFQYEFLVFVDNTCHALLADKLECSGMATGFG